MADQALHDVTKTTPNGSTVLRFEWHGGAYIQVYWFGGDIPLNVDAIGTGKRVPFEVINVWDHETDLPRIPRDDPQKFDARIEEWIQDNVETYEL